MTNASRIAFSALILSSLASCNFGDTGCSSKDALAPLTQILTESIQEDVAERLSEQQGGNYVSRAKIRAAVHELKLLVEDIRTSRDDPSSSKEFCTANLRVRFPVDTLEDADVARRTAKLQSLTELADANGIERRADSFSSEIEFNVQPTDDGDKIFAETETGTPMIQFVGEVVASSLVRARLEQGARAADQAAAEQKTASLEAARIDNKLASQSILASWRALSSSTRAQYLPSQRAWARKKDADCQVEAAGRSTDPNEVEAARLACDTRITNERTDYLEELRAGEAVPSAEADTSVSPEPVAVQEPEGDL